MTINKIRKLFNKNKKQHIKSVMLLDTNIFITHKSRTYYNLIEKDQNCFDEYSLKLVENIISTYDIKIAIFSDKLLQYNSRHKYIEYLNNQKADILADAIIEDTTYWRQPAINTNSRERKFKEFIKMLQNSSYDIENFFILDNHTYEIGSENIYTFFASRLDGLSFNTYHDMIEIMRKIYV